MNKDIKNHLTEYLQEKLHRFGIKPNELTAGFDLVRSGFVNSLEFVELVTRLEKHYHIEIDFEKALESDGFTTFGGLVDTIEKQING